MPNPSLKYFEIQVLVKGHKPMRELILGTSKGDAMDRARSKYRYINANVDLVSEEAKTFK